MKTRRVFLIIVLLVGSVTIGMAITACTVEKAISENQTSGETFSTVVQMGDKKLTLGPPLISPGEDEFLGTVGIVTVVVKNSGNVPIALAEIEIVYWDQALEEALEEIRKENPEYYQELIGRCGEECAKYGDRVRIKNLSPGEVQSIVLDPVFGLAKREEGLGDLEISWVKGSLQVKLKRIE